MLDGALWCARARGVPTPPDLSQATTTPELETAGLGSAEGRVPYGGVEAVRIHALGGLAIAAHVRGSKGLLEECRGQTLDWILANARFDAVEFRRLP